ncbi:MAG: ABC transporter ATP-binding protein [Candidatus Dormibacteraeota bacterium]|uniref:ABC transporter ATP-binding protein n=1 Tax=Candidatus Amunia macphersoniae TaxID=3127014 RepID=A0A934KKE1_9BACT|nr:ABC transporter ATP-binding protein [Candidatus Dormibacteraeota bacterium]
METLAVLGPAIDVVGVSKSFRKRRGSAWRGRAEVRKLALDRVWMCVERGEIVGIVGLNGSGKSTLIRVLATLTTPDSGTVRIFDRDIIDDAAWVRRHINRVSVDAAFAKEMSPWENLSFASRLYGDHAPDRRRRALAALARLGLPRDTVDQPMKQLSRGQQQKVAIARSLLTAPSLLLMDEPTTGLDPRSKREVQSFVRSLHADTGATVLVCTHDLDEAEALCGRVLMLDRGRIVADGSPAELRVRHGQTPGATLEDVFLHLTGRSFGDDREDGDGDGDREGDGDSESDGNGDAVESRETEVAR